ncbi:AI-2E family transporter [Paenibacillus xerothermodurans]|uniref:AI-2E family transporter n=1 Tax=Paenibacillus xerothermodurans TaxID=1977292 RepID=A0A2W1NRT5_PAEXE|nr:AI-2E family transporter [Paenibacillus xerothermodurans]PZE22265.1 AI-2E family transporter [Paenibacillus xerothermodurans]
MLLQSKFFKICLGIICVLLIILLLSKVNFIFKPLYMMFNILIVPITLSGFLYYLMRPIVNFLSKRKVNTMVAILLMYFLLGTGFILFLVMVWPTLETQMNNFTQGAPELVQQFQQQVDELQQNRLVSMFWQNGSSLSTQLSEYLSNGIKAARNYMSGAISLVTNFVIVVATVPIILYYMLKEGDQLPSSVLHIIPRRYRADGKKAIHEIDSALSGFIVGRVIITLLLGVIMFLGFLLIGLPYPLLLALVGTVFNLIPYVGPILGAVPVLIVAFTESASMVLWSLVVIIVAQQVEETLLSPHIYGKKLDIHPLTTVIILLVAGDMGGILGLILAIPVYMVIKIVVVHIYRLFFEEKVEELVEEA